MKVFKTKHSKIVMLSGALILGGINSALGAASQPRSNSMAEVNNIAQMKKNQRLAQSMNVNQVIESAKRGDASSQFNLAVMLYKGENMPQNRNEAYRWFKAAADQGHQKAKLNLDLFTMNDEVFDLIILGAEQGLDFAQHQVGNIYYYGNGVPQDYDKAFEWYAKAANQNYLDSKFSIAVMALKGEGFDKDEKVGFEIMENAASQGHADSQAMLGILYRNGKGVKRNDKKAVEWFQKAANQEKPIAQNALGMMYLYGEGVKMDTKQAAFWFNNACNNGLDDGCQALAKLNDLTSKQASSNKSQPKKNTGTKKRR